MTEQPSVHTGDARERRILIVEDVETTRLRVVHTLRRRGYQVEEATDGLDALQKASQYRFDAILLDLLMPHVDGWQFRDTQLRHPELATIPTVVLTVRPLREADRYLLRPHAVVYKPFEDEELLAAVDTACETAKVPLPEQPPNPTQLFWSRRGEIACWAHSPSADPQRWHAERWMEIPDAARKHGIVYQCQHCDGHAGPVHHRSRSTPAGPCGD